MRAYSRIPSTINRAFACLRKMLNMAEVWGYRPDGSNPCRHVPMYPEKGKTRFITDEELVHIYEYLDRADEEGLEHPLLTLGYVCSFLSQHVCPRSGCWNGRGWILTIVASNGQTARRKKFPSL